MTEPESEAARASARLGQVVRGKYRLDRVLGIGGMATVYAATHRNGMEVAVKILHATRTTNPDVCARFLREGVAANALKHPGAVKVVDDDVAEDGSPFLVMELLHGEPLDAVWDRCGRVMPMGTVLALGFQLCDVLSVAHAAGILHRDIKPQNLFLTVDGQLKVLDFGVARLREETASTGTATGMVLGTPAYMSPEQAGGETRKVGPQSDLYSVGATLFALASGASVHEGENPQQIVIRAATTPARSLATVMPSAPPALVQVVDRALAFDPASRWGGAAEMRDALATVHAEILGPMPETIPLPRLTGLAWFRNTSAPPAALTGSDVSTSAPVARTPVASTPVTGPSAQSARDPSVDPGSRAATTERGAAPRRSRAFAATVAVSTGLLGVGLFLGIRGLQSRDETRTSVASASATASTPPPPEPIPAAMVAYRAAVQAEHDANRDVAEASFLTAANADPGMGAAHLRFAVSALLHEHAGDAHSHFLKATGLRSALSAHDATLLDAFAPLFEKHPPDWADAERRLDAASKRFPNDTEILFHLSKVELQRDELDAAIATADAALAVDPRFAGALFAKEIALAHRGDIAGVVQAADHCLEAAPQATACLGMRLDTYSELGRCNDVEREARQLISINPEGTAGFFALAEAGFVRGRSATGVLESLKAEWKNQGGDAAWAEAADRADLAALVGDAAELTNWVDAMERIAGDTRDAFQHMNAAWMRVETSSELGAADRAASAANDFLERKSAWQEDPGVDMQAIAFDVVPMMSKAMELGGKITPADLELRRDHWISGWRQRLSPGMAGFLWIYGFAQTVSTPAEARAALDALPQFPPLPQQRPTFIPDAAIGRTYLLAGRANEAIPVLERASARCDPFEDPFAYVHASLWLGEALLAEGRKDEACAAFQRVVTAWKGFGARSVSVREARGKGALMGCALK